MNLFAPTLATLLLAGTVPVIAQQAAAQAPADKPFAAGQPLGVMQDDVLQPISDNVKVYGAIVSAESCSYDETRDLIVVPNRGADQKAVQNDAFVSLINHDGSVNTARWIGVNRDGLVLNDPFGSDIQNGKLYLADRDGGTDADTPSVSVVRMFDLETGAPAGEVVTKESPWFNDIEVAPDGTIYGTQTGSGGQTADPTTWRVYKVTPDGTSSVFVEGAPLNLPNGIAFDNDGNIVVVNIGDDAVLTFSPTGELLKTEHAAQAGSDGLAILADGTKYVGSVRQGGISRIRPGEDAELIATGIPSAASLCYDAGANQLVIPTNSNNALAFVKLDE
ncbi:MAG TPA: SMP-30/gluconolactonase/LRE family protein [Devosia sp.]|nr:SMP-30/gluconolactonase/LRE family protein [Devosia sp.]